MAKHATYRCGSCGGVNRVDPARETPRCGRCQEPLDLSNPPAEVDDDGLARLVRAADVPVLVDFWAPWCGPCRTVAPALVELARRHAGRLLVAKVNVDHHKRTAGALGVQGIPTLAVYRDGQLRASEAGARTGAALDAWVAPHL